MNSRVHPLIRLLAATMLVFAIRASASAWGERQIVFYVYAEN